MASFQQSENWSRGSIEPVRPVFIHLRHLSVDGASGFTAAHGPFQNRRWKTSPIFGPPVRTLRTATSTFSHSDDAF
ncbi:hypothetical protein HPP92_011582 [Vanilla planifolia]|uniref:Uncharacterized protein n=1 Tax=Vanilla planifolia TaxID=51239 RepID=A0A835QXW1_VANPL|nr:hypothetical protein HPP92_011582 [Vanilla planifolia]